MYRNRTTAPSLHVTGDLLARHVSTTGTWIPWTSTEFLVVKHGICSVQPEM
jgi:hypothetical protein